MICFVDCCTFSWRFGYFLNFNLRYCTEQDWFFAYGIKFDKWWRWWINGTNLVPFFAVVRELWQIINFGYLDWRNGWLRRRSQKGWNLSGGNTVTLYNWFWRFTIFIKAFSIVKVWRTCSRKVRDAEIVFLLFISRCTLSRSLNRSNIFFPGSMQCFYILLPWFTNLAHDWNIAQCRSDPGAKCS